MALHQQAGDQLESNDPGGAGEEEGGSAGKF